jgi:WD40 repeat protein
MDTKLKKIDQDLDRHTANALTVTFKGDRPFKVFTGSEDTNVNFFKGPPFNLEKTIDNSHTKFVNVVRAHPGNKFVVSAGSDLNLVIYNAETGEITEKKEKIHDGSIYSIVFFDGGNKMVTCSADKTLKVWKWDGLELLHTLIVSDKPAVEDMQVGVVVTKDYIISLSLKGVLNYWKLSELEGETVKPGQVQAGHRKNVLKSWYSNGSLLTVDCEGRILHFANLTSFPEFKDLNRGVNQAAFLKDGSAIVVSSGDKISVHKTPSFEDVFEVKADGFVNAVEFVSEKKVVALTNKSTITAYEDGNAVGSLNLGEEGLCVSLSTDKSIIYVGGSVSIQN